MTLIWNESVMGDGAVIAHADHPLSLGYRVVLVTNDKRFRKPALASQKQWEHLWSGTNPANGMHAVWNNLHLVAIIIDGYEDGARVTRGRLVQLIVHEASHCVDGFLERAQLRKVDTELRAYFLDWIVGNALKYLK